MCRLNINALISFGKWYDIVGAFLLYKKLKNTFCKSKHNSDLIMKRLKIYSGIVMILKFDRKVNFLTKKCCRCQLIPTWPATWRNQTSKLQAANRNVYAGPDFRPSFLFFWVGSYIGYGERTGSIKS